MKSMQSVMTKAAFAAVVALGLSFLPESRSEASSADSKSQVDRQIDARLHALLGRLAQEAQAQKASRR